MFRNKIIIFCSCFVICLLSSCSWITITDSNDVSDVKTSSFPKDVVSQKNRNEKNLKSVPTHEPTISPAPTDYIEYDALQQLYLDLDATMSYKEMMHLVKSTKLPYSVEKNNGSRTVQVAFTDGCTVQHHKKENGDYLTIIYEYPESENSSNDVLDKYIFGTCAYIPCDSDLELINHSYGYYFSYYEPGNYISDFNNDLDLDKKMSKKEQLDYYFKNK